MKAKEREEFLIDLENRREELLELEHKLDNYIYSKSFKALTIESQMCYNQEKVGISIQRDAIEKLIILNTAF